MSWLSARAAKLVLSSFLLTAAAVACAHGRGTRPAETPTAENANRDASTVTADEIERDAGKPIEQVVQGRIAGVDVRRTPDGGIAVNIRNASSFYGGVEPLYVVDGSPFNPGPGGALVGINPYDIESIRVLKNPEDIGVYGMRGANGVIVITMKKPKRQ